MKFRFAVQVFWPGVAHLLGWAATRSRKAAKLMRKRWQFVLVIMFLAIAGEVAWQLLSPREPFYQGKRLSQWLQGYTAGTESPEIDEAVRNIGTNAIPTLLRALRVKGSATRKTISLPPLVRVDLEFVDIQNMQAQKGFEALGVEARAAVPALIEIYEQNICLSSQTGAAAALAAIGPEAKSAIPSLILNTTNTSPAVRAVAVATLGEIHCEPERVVPALVQSLSDPDKEVRLFAAFSLRGFGGDARAAIPALIEALKDPFNQVRGNAAWALGEIHGQPEFAVPALVETLRDTNSLVRTRAACTLKKFGADARPAAKALVELLDDPDEQVKDSAAQALRAIDPEAADKAGPR